MRPTWIIFRELESPAELPNINRKVEKVQSRKKYIETREENDAQLTIKQEE